MRAIDIRQIITRLILLFLLLSGVACSHSQNNKNRKKTGKIPEVVAVETFRLDSLKGWGYEIVINNKVFIHQEHIPALEGNRYFVSREEAMKVGNMVRNKLQNHRPPVITKQEIDSLLDRRE